jgi:hypothetical protein
LRSKEAVALPVQLDAIFEIVLAAVNFDNNSGAERREVDDVLTDRCLLAKVKTELF